jgi:NAD(P)-dependent dehydrogenase (short-subunit alcohol dehydrogenase family)
MQDFSGKVAVVTGAASGIGFALAKKFAAEKMCVVLADVEADALSRAAEDLRATGATILAVQTDVSKARDVESLASSAISAFGKVHILCNNAGVGAPRGPIWEASLEDWSWVIGVNLYGVIHGIRTFVSLMLRQGEAAHMVNTASIAGLLSGEGMGVYAATKQAVVSISEVLSAELAAAGAPIGVSVLCPAFVSTRIMDSARNRPVDLPSAAPQLSTDAQASLLAFRSMIEGGMPADAVAEKVFAAIKTEEFYVLTDPEYNAAILQRAEGIVGGRKPEGRFT